MRLKVLFSPGSDIWENINQTYRFSGRKNLENSNVERDWVGNIGRKLDANLQCSITAKESFLNHIFFLGFYSSGNEEFTYLYSGRSNNHCLGFFLFFFSVFLRNGKWKMADPARCSVFLTECLQASLLWKGTGPLKTVCETGQPLTRLLQSSWKGIQRNAMLVTAERTDLWEKIKNTLITSGPCGL